MQINQNISQMLKKKKKMMTKKMLMKEDFDIDDKND